MWSRLSVHFQFLARIFTIFRLSPAFYGSHFGSRSNWLSLAVTGCHWLSPCLSLAPYGSLWLPLWLPLALTGSLRLLMALSGSYWIFPCLSLALNGSLWLPLWLPLALTVTLWLTLALSGSLLLSNFACTVLDRVSGPLLGSQGPCSALSAAATLTHFIPVWIVEHALAFLQVWKDRYWIYVYLN